MLSFYSRIVTPAKQSEKTSCGQSANFMLRVSAEHSEVKLGKQIENLRQKPPEKQ